MQAKVSALEQELQAVHASRTADSRSLKALEEQLAAARTRQIEADAEASKLSEAAAASAAELTRLTASASAAESRAAAAEARAAAADQLLLQAKSDMSLADTASVSKAAAEASAAAQSRLEAQLHEVQRDLQAAKTAAASLQTKVKELEAAASASAAEHLASIARSAADAAAKDAIHKQLVECKDQAAQTQAQLSQSLAAAEAEIAHQKALVAAAANARTQAEADMLSLQPLEQKLADAEAQTRSLTKEVSRLQEESNKTNSETAKLHASQQAAALQLQVILSHSAWNIFSQSCLTSSFCSKCRKKPPTQLLPPLVLNSNVPTLRAHLTKRAHAAARLKLKTRHCAPLLKMFTVKELRLLAGDSKQFEFLLVYIIAMTDFAGSLKLRVKSYNSKKHLSACCDECLLQICIVTYIFNSQFLMHILQGSPCSN